MAELIRLARRGRRAEHTGKAMRRVAALLITLVAAYLWRGFILMLAVGFVHDVWLPSLPTIGYWYSVLAFALLDSIFGIVDITRKPIES